MSFVSIFSFRYSAAILPTLPTPGRPSINTGSLSSGFSTYLTIIGSIIHHLYFQFPSIFSVMIFRRKPRWHGFHSRSSARWTNFFKSVSSTFWAFSNQSMHNYNLLWNSPSPPRALNSSIILFATLLIVSSALL